MLDILKTSDKDFAKRFKAVLKRNEMELEQYEEIARQILNDVKKQGQDAILRHIQKFDGWTPKNFDEVKLDFKSCEVAFQNLDSQSKEALKTAYERIFDFHAKQKEKSWISTESNGFILGQQVTPLKRAGLYIPGGKAAYPSSLLMNAVPAIVAGVDELVVCTPAVKNKVNDLLLAALYLCSTQAGRDIEAYKVGGASAVAMMAYGLDSENSDSEKILRKVDVITGPGNIFVASAKKMVFGDVNIDMVAGPSEIGVIAQKGANVRYTALDLLSQAEHDELASSILISDDLEFLNSVIAEIKAILPTLSRAQIATKSIENRAIFIHAKDLQECIDLMNEIAPEHLEILTPEPFALLPKIKNAGAIFLGQYSSEPVGDYLAGPNHTLPTGGSAKFFSPLGVEHFMKKSSIIYCSKDAMSELGGKCAHLAHLEGLEAHKLAVLERLKDI